MAPTSPSSTADTLERGFIFRVGRLIPLILAVVAGGIAAISLVVILVSLVPPSRPTAPQANAAPAPVVVSAADIAERLAPSQTSSSTRNVAATYGDTVTPVEAVQIATQLHAIRMLMGGAGVPWENRYRTVCTSSYAGYCFDTARRLASRGASPDIDAVLDLYDQSSLSKAVTVADGATPPAGTARTRYVYEVNYSNASPKQAALEEAESILAATSSKERRATLRAWSELRVERESARQQTISADQERVASESAMAAAEYESARTRRKLWRASALTATGVALASIFTIALLLGVLAIERNTRALRERGTTALRSSA